MAELLCGTEQIQRPKYSGFIVEINKYIINKCEYTDILHKQQLLPNKGLFNCIFIEKFGVLKVLLLKIQIFWDFVLCCLENE